MKTNNLLFLGIEKKEIEIIEKINLELNTISDIKNLYNQLSSNNIKNVIIIPIVTNHNICYLIQRVVS